MQKTTFVISTITLCLVLLLSSACANNKDKIIREESGMFTQTMKIRSLPTKAKIYINDREVGTTPLKYEFGYEDSRLVNIKAVPLYPNQYTQNIFLMLPPIPKTMTIYMNHFPPDYERNKESEFKPPEKPKPEVIVQTEVDTVYIEKEVTKIQSLSLPAIYFETDQYNIQASEEEKLQDLIRILNEYPDFYLDIYGFADTRASVEYNLKLTFNRANAVKEYLIERGIDPARLSAYGHGKVSKISSEGLDLDLSQSRKVLFLLKKKP